MIHLHTHSMFSLRDSIIKPDDLVKRLKEIGQTKVAITDHGGSLGGVYLYKILTEAGIEYIHGVEFYVCDDVKVKDKNSKYNHLIALCKNETGRVNMNTLISLSEHPDNYYFKPRIDFDLLSQYGDGLVIMSACLAGEVSRCILSGNTGEAKEVARKYKERFGDDYYLEIQSHRGEEQISVNKEILKLAKELKIKTAVTSDAHYTWEEDSKYQAKYAFNGGLKEAGETYLDCFVQSENDVKERLWYLDSDTINNLIKTTHEIADKCHLQLPLSAPIMPKVDTPYEFSNNKEWLINLCSEGFKEKLNINLQDKCQYDKDRKIFKPIYNDDENSDDYGELVGYDEVNHTPEEIEEYIQRYEYELDCLDRMGFIDYILLVYSYANIADRRGIARGSGGGSLICYITNITNIDPIEHGLYFERFIDVGALKLLETGEITPKELKIPDIDLDFSGDSCKQVLNFIYDKYGEDKVASIGKFGTNQTKGTIRDMCKVLDISLEQADLIAKAFTDYEINDIDAMIEGTLDKTPKAADAINYVQEYPELFDYVRKLNKLPKSFGLHACGKIISTRELDYYLPSCYDSDGIRYLQGDMHDVEDMGLVKIDVLGLRTLDQEYDTLEMSGEDKDFLNPKQSYNDEKVLDVFRQGDTLGIFQFSSNGMKQTLKKMNVSGIDDLSAANALFRPGSMAYIDDYCDRKNGKAPITYLHPDLEDILRNTYGIIVFQEQLIEIGRLAGMHNPDLLRKATGKKNPKLLAQVKPELNEKLLARGWSQEQFDTLWADMLEFAKYSFNKSHSSAYAILAYITAKQKAYYPAEFYAGLCNSYIGHSDYVKEEAGGIIADAKRHKVSVAPFNFRDDCRKCYVKDKKIVYAIPLIRECNSEMANILYSFRDTGEKYFWRLCIALKNAGIQQSQLKILLRLGYFSEYGNIKQLLYVFDNLGYFKFGDRKTVTKAEVADNEFMRNIIAVNSVSIGKNGNELTRYRELNLPNIFDAYEDKIMSMDIQDVDFKIKIATQVEYLGFVSLTTGREEDRNKLRIKDVIPLYRKKDKVQFGYSVVTQSIGSGIESRFTVFNRVYDKEPVQKNDIIICTGWQREGQYFTMTSYRKTFT